MTVIKFLNSFFYLLIYPFLIGNLGAENYGLFIFATSTATYFQAFISFGFDFPAVKQVALEPDNINAKSDIVSSVLSAKIFLFFISIVIFSIFS
jgi:PST family polysaccharide transporter